ncbi:MAG: hypothetical protein OZ921_09090 [Sorangiineae bacterium]|nr:hypothetical protein [Polyangiaceae bacterium]MEB2322657.1 hypothetical protein [Sorangiineae bacterium]
MIDENAFGFLISWYDAEDEEYALEPSEFAERWAAFHRAGLACLEELPLGAGARALELGHAFYFELAEGDQATDPMGWLKGARARFAQAGFVTVGVLTHGGRWVDDAPLGERAEIGGVAFVGWSRPSEPLRRALYADTAARSDDEAEAVGWGPGCYYDLEAVEALGRRPKNAPTPLRVGGAAFYRVGG